MDFRDNEVGLVGTAAVELFTAPITGKTYVVTGLNIANVLDEVITVKLEKFNGTSWVTVCEAIEIGAKDTFEYYENGAKANVTAGKKMRITSSVAASVYATTSWLEYP